ncbi:hypothetical protein RCI18_02520, partial [Staphylococcus haemolyticus]|uniref:hypothetical protein n=1 Tax=Staphylococcus haemolyticus TaxID=1283 RepID=UPI0027FDEC8D
VKGLLYGLFTFTQLYGLYLRLLISLIESYFSMNFGIDFLLHNNYVTYGAIALLVVSAFLQELIEHQYNNNESLF